MGKLTVAIVSEQRWRECMEDTNCLVENFAGKKNHLFGGVFDGHGGYKVAAGLADNMANFVKKEILAGKTPGKAFAAAYAKAVKSEWAQTATAGSCATTFLIRGKTVTCANIGDCRIVVTGKSVRQLTIDHDTRNAVEAQRIRKSGAQINTRGYVDNGEHLLAPTRAIGDLDFKNSGVISTPDISIYTLKSTDRFIVAASDGLFGGISNEEVFDIAYKCQTAAELARLLQQEVEHRSGSDNLTIIVVQIR
jgi:serine/threonine protein phosphatase PrpC